MRQVRLAIVSTHPIQYYAPVFRALAGSANVMPRVFFTWSQAESGPVFDPGFGAAFEWDIPLRDGYDHVFVPNIAGDPRPSHFRGIRNPSLIDEITEWGADAVLVYGWNLHSHLIAMRHFKGRIPVLFRGDSTLLDSSTRIRRLARAVWLRWVYSKVDVAISVGQNNRDYYLWSGVRPERIAFAPHSVDTERFQELRSDDAGRVDQRRDELGIRGDAVAILFAAKFLPKKDPMLLLDAFISLQPRAHLIFVGNGELETAMRERARGLRNVRFLPFQNQGDMPLIYRVGDVYVLPSRGPGETWGLALNEAMASGRAVIAGSRVGGARDLVEPGATGWVFESGDREDLARVLGTAVSLGREGLRRMGEDAQKKSSSWSTQAAAAAIASTVISACAARFPKMPILA
jgi:glycosyltransferase involved in cell wall biosynthesis